jgi:Uma2 family endonuclease
MAADPLLERRLFTVDDYERMVEAGILDADSRVELLEGEIVTMAAIGSRHASIVNRVTRLLVRRVGDDVLVTPGNPLRLPPRSEPEPDLMLVRFRGDYYAAGHPTARDALLVVEVSDSSIGKDRAVKVPIYAGQGIPEVWVVDIGGDRVIVHTRPGDGDYGLVRSALRGEELRPMLVPEVAITIEEVLGER